ncbi:MAG: hypothetical protein ABW174_13860 [Flavitalea sp.]
MKKNLQVPLKYKPFKADPIITSPLRVVRDEVDASKKKGPSKRFWIISAITVAALVAGYFAVSFVQDVIDDEEVPQQIRQSSIGGERTFL